MKTTKTFFLAITVVLLSVFATSCISTTQDPPTPINANTFEVNINIDAGIQSAIIKTIVIDNDSLTFGLGAQYWYGPATYLGISTNSPNFEMLNIKQDGFNLYTNTYDITHYYADPSDVNTLDSGIIINNSYTTHPWVPFLFSSGTYYSMYNTKLFQFNYDGYQYLIQGMPRNENQYIVLRKLKGIQYQYYWIRVRNDDTAPLVVTGGDCRINTKILNGKYQLNSITTGQ